MYKRQLHALKADLGEDLGYPVAHRVRFPATVLEAECDVVIDPFHDQLGGRILEQQPYACCHSDRTEREGIFVVELEGTLYGRGDLQRDEARDRQGERALPGAGRPDDQEDGTRGDVEVDAPDSGKVGPGIGDREIPDPERDRGQSGNPSSTPARLRARWSATEPPATKTTAEIPIATPRTIWISGSTVA